ncbi:hypothetical protein [Streptomyces sp. F001]|uniref:hypothetical protein n=1 Tax=Streptomyces sp. F001 TaxID=1510026 RepID=UPI00101E4460|nr:hypothetical protein [Streptomyces sp. F001]
MGDEQRNPLITTERGPSLRELFGERSLTATTVACDLGDGRQTTVRFVADEGDVRRGGYTIVAADGFPGRLRHPLAVQRETPSAPPKFRSQLVCPLTSGYSKGGWEGAFRGHQLSNRV